MQRKLLRLVAASAAILLADGAPAADSPIVPIPESEVHFVFDGRAVVVRDAQAGRRVDLRSLAPFARASVGENAIGVGAFPASYAGVGLSGDSNESTFLLGLPGGAVLELNGVPVFPHHIRFLHVRNTIGGMPADLFLLAGPDGAPPSAIGDRLRRYDWKAAGLVGVAADGSLLRGRLGLTSMSAISAFEMLRAGAGELLAEKGSVFAHDPDSDTPGFRDRTRLMRYRGPAAFSQNGLRLLLPEDIRQRFLPDFDVNRGIFSAPPSRYFDVSEPIGTQGEIWQPSPSGLTIERRPVTLHWATDGSGNRVIVADHPLAPDFLPVQLPVVGKALSCAGAVGIL